MRVTRQEGVRGSPSSVLVKNNWVESAHFKNRHMGMVVPFSNMGSTTKWGWRMHSSPLYINISVPFCLGVAREGPSIGSFFFSFYFMKELIWQRQNFPSRKLYSVEEGLNKSSRVQLPWRHGIHWKSSLLKKSLSCYWVAGPDDTWITLQSRGN